MFFIPAFNGLGSPYWDAQARGAIIGITRGTSSAHIARAALESIALQSVELLQAMQADAQVRLKELRVDGGAAVNDLLMQMQADLLGVPVMRPVELEATAYGAAALAACSAGFDDFGAARRTAVEVFEPKFNRDQAQWRIERWKQAVKRSFAWAL